MVKFLTSRPIAVIMVFIAILMLGIVSYRLLPISLMPDIDIPEITVQVSYPNSSARELENALTKNLRAQLMQVAHLSDITSETRDGRGVIHLSFDYGTPIDYAFIEVNEKIDAAMNYLPRDMDRPQVIKASATDLPVFYLNITLQDDSLSKEKNKTISSAKFIELSEFCENVIRRRIEQLTQVAMVDLSGTMSPEILVKPDKKKLESLNISYDKVQQAIEQSNINPGNIMVRDGYYQYYIRFTSYLKNPSDIGNIYIRTGTKILQLKDIADITIQAQKPQGMFLSGNKQAITMAIIQQSDARMADLKTELNKMIDRFKIDYPYLSFDVAQDQSQILDFSMSNLQQDLLMGCIMAFLVLFLFLNDLRAPVLIGVTVPISLVISFLFFKLFHLSINIISLSGLALGIGMIIDCSIIVIENILYYREKGLSLDEACVRGTNEVIRPMLSSTLTTSAVFMPLIFISGMAGALFYDEAVSVSIGNAASFIVAITILPVMFVLLYKSRVSRTMATNSFSPWKSRLTKFRKALGKLSFGKKLEKKYEHGVAWVFRHKTLTTILFFASIAMNVVLYKLVKKEVMPTFKQIELVVNVEWNENIHVDENRQRILNLLKPFKNHIIQSNSRIGEQQFILTQTRELDYFEAEMYLKMKDPESLTVVQDSLRLLVQQRFPAAKITFREPENIFERIFSNNDPPLLAKVSVSDVGRLNPDTILNFVSETDKRLNAVIPNRIPLKEHLSISIDQEKLLLYGVDYSTVYHRIKTAFNENKFATLRSYQRFMPILLGEDSKMVGSVLSTKKVTNNKGEELPLSTFIKIQRERDLKYITAGQQGEYISLQYHIIQSDADQYKSTITSIVKEKHYPDVQFAGSLVNSERMIGKLSVILIISLLLLYFILAAQFESLLQPFIVLLELPVDFAGALFVLWICGSSLNIMSGIGIIIMTGVIINDSILKVDTINQLRKDGLSLMEAIKQGGALRLGSILMTASTTILAVVPFFFGNDMGSALQKPLSLALIGGMVVGTVVSLFFVPLVYWWIYRKSETVVSSEVKDN